MLTVIDEYTRECLALEIARRVRNEYVMHIMADLFIERGLPDHLRSDNGSKLTAKAIREWA